MVKKILIGLLIVLIVIQFFRPSKNTSEQLITEKDISKSYALPDDVHKLLIAKCYDCHSNHTNYPWYFSIQPVAWWLAGHINEGKEELNFSEFTTYPEKKALHKLEEVGEVVDDDTMPLKSYTLLHPDAKLSEAEKQLIFSWLTSLSIDYKKPH